MKKNTKEIVSELTDYVNSFDNKSEEFNTEMSYEHRTLQQSFTRLCLGWIEFVASEEYRTDGRNESSKTVCDTMMNAFRKEVAAQGYTSNTLELMAKPSTYCAFI